MASEQPYLEINIDGYPKARLFKWVLANGDWGYPVILPLHADKTVQVVGTFGVGGTVVIEGSVMKVAQEWSIINDTQGNALSFSGPKIETLLENPYQVRPKITVGDETTDLDIYLLVKE